MNTLDNKVAVITGAASGIGLATAELFLQEGAQVMLVDVNEEKLIDVCAGLNTPKAKWCTANIIDEAANQGFVKATSDTFGGIDIAVLNAGIFGGFGSISDGDTGAFDAIMSVNVRGLWLGLKYVIPEMRKRGAGSIVITGSTAGFRAGAAGRAGYVTSKHATIGLMRAAAAECGPYNIRVNTTSPGGVDTPMVEELMSAFSKEEAAEVSRKFSATTLLNRAADPAEIANMNLFLASDASSYCTGSNYMVDGGLLT